MNILNRVTTWPALSLKLRLLRTRFGAQTKKSCAATFMGIALFSGLISSGPALAWMASEFTQVMNNIQLVMQYAKQVQQYQAQLQQYQTMLKNLEQNPGGIMREELNGMMDEIGNVMTAQNSIGGSMAKIDANFQSRFGNQVLGSLADKFKLWTDTTRDTLGGAMRSAGLHRDSYASDALALKALFNQSQNSSGAVAAIQQLSALTTMQVQQSQKLGDLLATQNVAASTWMAANQNKQQAEEDRSAAVAGAPTELPAGSKKSDFVPMKIKK